MTSRLNLPGKLPSRRTDLDGPTELPDDAVLPRQKTVKALLPHLVSSLFIGDDCTPDVGQFDGLPNSPNASPRYRLHLQQQQQQYRSDADRSATVSASTSCHHIVTSLIPPWQFDFDESRDEISKEVAADGDVLRDEVSSSGADKIVHAKSPSRSPTTSNRPSPRYPLYLVSNVFDSSPIRLTTGKKCDYTKRDNVVIGCDVENIDSSKKRQPSDTDDEHPPSTSATGSPRAAAGIGDGADEPQRRARPHRHIPCRKPVTHRADSTYEVFHHVNVDESSLTAASTAPLQSCPVRRLILPGLEGDTATPSTSFVSPRGLNPRSPRPRCGDRSLVRREDTISELLCQSESSSSTSVTISSARAGKHANGVDTKLNVFGGNMDEDERQRQWLAEQNRELTVHSPSITGELLGRPRLRRRAAWDSDSKETLFGAGRSDNGTPSQPSPGSVRTRRPDNVAYLFGDERQSPVNHKSMQFRHNNYYGSSPDDGVQAAGLLTRPGLQRENTFHNLFGQPDPIPCCASPTSDRFTSKAPKLVKDTVSEHLNSKSAYAETRVPGRRPLVEWDRTNTITGQSLPYIQPSERVESRSGWIDGHYQELVARQCNPSFTHLSSATTTTLASDSVTEVNDDEFDEDLKTFD